MIYFRLTVPLLVLLLAQSAQADPMTWLMKINHAAGNLSFSGVFVHVRDDQLEATQVVRRVKDKVIQERLYSLSGETREVVRDADRIWCYIPEEKVGVRDYRQAFESGFPRIAPGDFDRLKRNYSFVEGGVARIADRTAQQIDVIPNDGYRYGYRLWADVETGLLLRSDLMGRDEQVVEKYLFVSIDVDSEISDHALQAVTGNRDLQWYGRDIPQPSASVEKSQWQFNQLPAGYRLSRHIRRMSPMEGKEIEHLIFTDGLSTVSVFIKQARAGQSAMEGLSRMGAVHAYRSTIDDYRVTVMGEAPAMTVELMAAGVVYAR